MEIILASNSPRRKELLEKAGVKFSVVASDYEEKEFSSNPVETAMAFARGKAEDVFNSLESKENVLVLGADTVVFMNGKILGKPNGESEARAMLRSLSGKMHSVVTGYYLASKKECIGGFMETLVQFNQLTDEVIDEYIESGLYKGKAGSYGIQDDFPLVEKYEGSLTNVIGLPMERIIPLINKIINE